MTDCESPRVWWEIAVRTSSAPAGADVIAEVLRSAVPAGIVETGDGFIAYLPDEGAARLAADAVAAACSSITGEVSSRLRPVTDTQWNNWRLAFRPVSVGRRLRIYPAWEAPGQGEPRAAGHNPAEIAVVIEPGLAFGTGDHPTTANCLRYLEDAVAPGICVLDAGTGSGILAIAAALLGASTVVAVDIDPIACRSAAANVDLNPGAAGKVTVVCGDLAELPGAAYDVILANITSDAIITLLPKLLSCLGADGRLIVSGISAERAGEVMLALETAGLAAVDRATERGWLTAYMRRGNAP